jgi:hypothetical protein
LVLMTDDTSLTAGFGTAVLERDSAGAPTIVVTPAGRGRIARTTVSAVPRRLGGDSIGYAELWSRVLDAVRRRSDTAVFVEGDGPRFANHLVLVVARGAPAPEELPVEAPDGTTDTVRLAVTPGDSNTRRGVFWPTRTGWYRVGGEAFFVHDSTEWIGVQAQRRIEATRARVAPSRPDTGAKRERVPLWPAFLGFLAAAGFLWWIHLRN